EGYVNAFVNDLKMALDAEGISAEVYGRPKHIYSIYNKLKKKDVDIDELYDIRAVRVLTDRVSSCYAVLGVVHGRWKHIPKEFDDYVANPKENGYQSLHTAVIGPEGKVVEVQIRTFGMHALAEQGIAAHWRYKEGGQQDQALDHAVNSLRKLLDHRDNDEDLLESFHTELFNDRVYVLTPRGDVLDLPKGATPLDFAYAIHSEVGHRCRGAKVDGRIVPLTYVLKSGEQVEVLTAKEPKPSRDWYNPNTGYLFSSRSRAKVRHWFAQLDREQNLADGRSILEREAHRLAVPVPDPEDLIKRFHVQSSDEFLLAIGRGDIRPGQLATALQEPDNPLQQPSFQKLRKSSSQTTGKEETDAVRVQGVGNLLTHFAQCCKPVPGDEVVAYITKGRGVTVHRIDCPNILNLSEDNRKRLIEAEWAKQVLRWPVDIYIEAFDRQGLLRDITHVLLEEKINVLAANTRTNRDDQSVMMHMEIEITDIMQLSRVLDKLNQLQNVITAGRKN
ncbi:RelA/SpoT family protein, partial [Acidihalobacter prosperus]